MILPKCRKKLNKLSFYYQIPFSNLSFSIPQTLTKFIYNSTYDEFITDRGINYHTFINRNQFLFKPLVAQPIFPSNSTAAPTTPGPSTVPTYELIHSSRPNRSRHGHNVQTNIDRLRAAAVITGGLTVNATTFMQRLANNSTTTNKDLMLLCLATHGIIDIDIQDEIEDPNISQGEELVNE